MWLALFIWAQSDGIGLTAQEAKPCGFVVEGKAALPDDAIVTIELYRDGAAQGPAVWYGISTVQGGTFRREVALFKEKNLKGKYLFRARFETDLQRAEHQKLRASVGETVLVVGTDDEIRADAALWVKRIDVELSDMNAQMEKAYDAVQKGGDPDALGRKLNDGMSEIIQRNSTVPEFRFLGLTPVTHGEFERLRALALACIDYAKAAAAQPDQASLHLSSANAAFIAFRRLLEKIRTELGLAQAAKIDMKKVLEELLTNTKQTAELFDQALKDGRRRAELRSLVDLRRGHARTLLADIDQSSALPERDALLAAGKDFFDRAAALGENPTPAALEELTKLNAKVDEAAQAFRKRLE